MLSHYTNKLISVLFFLAVFILLLGCSSSPLSRAPKAFNTTDEKGLIIGTISFDKEKALFPNYALIYDLYKAKKKSMWIRNGKFISVQPSQGNAKFYEDFSNDKTISYIFVLKLPIGNYEIFNYSFFLGYASTTYRSDNDFSLPFEVKAGQINYIGEYKINQSCFKSTFLSGKQISPKVIEVSDKFDRDMAQLKSKLPAIDWSKVVNNTIKNGSDTADVIEFK